MSDESEINQQEISEPMKTDFQILSFDSEEAFESWLDQNHSVAKGIWLRFYKKGSGIPSIVYKEALNVALCYGWIDSQLDKANEASYLQKFTPRRTKSLWSKRNIENVLRLEEEGRMRPSGMVEVEKAKSDGRWEKAYDSPGNMEVPDDFMQELSKNKKAFAFFESLNKTNKYAIGWRIQTAKTDEIRSKRIKDILFMMEKEEKFH
ncbi:MAG: YdeI/OmpD-associated family protein [Paludibacter sp.]|nr:YdeI/OmpD-associated family protein [Paludibacter sp.]